MNPKSFLGDVVYFVHFFRNKLKIGRKLQILKRAIVSNFFKTASNLLVNFVEKHEDMRAIVETSPYLDLLGNYGNQKKMNILNNVP
jgi:uncharacterized protein YeeX (DUF496 family)